MANNTAALSYGEEPINNSIRASATGVSDFYCQRVRFAQVYNSSAKSEPAMGEGFATKFGNGCIHEGRVGSRLRLHQMHTYLAIDDSKEGRVVRIMAPHIIVV